MAESTNISESSGQTSTGSGNSSTGFMGSPFAQLRMNIDQLFPPGGGIPNISEMDTRNLNPFTNRGSSGGQAGGNPFGGGQAGGNPFGGGQAGGGNTSLNSTDNSSTTNNTTNPMTDIINDTIDNLSTSIRQGLDNGRTGPAIASEISETVTNLVNSMMSEANTNSTATTSSEVPSAPASTDDTNSVIPNLDVTNFASGNVPFGNDNLTYESVSNFFNSIYGENSPLPPASVIETFQSLSGQGFTNGSTDSTNVNPSTDNNLVAGSSVFPIDSDALEAIQTNISNWREIGSQFTGGGNPFVSGSNTASGDTQLSQTLDNAVQTFQSFRDTFAPLVNQVNQSTDNTTAI